MPALVRRIRLAALAAAVAVAGAAGAGEPVPSAAELKEAVGALREVYEKDYTAAEADAKGKRALARKLFETAPKRKTPAMRYASYDEARKVAASGGDAKLALAAGGALAAEFGVAPAWLEVQTFRLLGDADLPPADAVALVAFATDLTNAALEREDYARAATLAALAAAAAKKTEDPEALLDARKFRAKVEALKAAVETVKTKPDDPAANEALGRYWAFTRGRWDAGLKHLAKSANKDLADAARRDLAAPKTAKDRTAAADAWYRLAKEHAGAERRLLVDRAWEWYAAAAAVAGADDPTPAERMKEIEKAYPELFDKKLDGHTGAVARVAVTPDGRTLVSVGNDNTVRLWDALTGKLLHTLEGHTGWVASVVVTPDGAHALTAGGDGPIRVWDLKAKKEVRVLEGHRIAVRGLALTADGATLVSGGTDKTCRAWDLATGRERRRYGDTADAIECVAVTPDGKYVLAGTDLGVVTVYDAKSGDVVSRFDKHDGMVVYAVATTADGKTAFSAGRDKDIHVWELATGKELRQLKGHSDQVYDLALSPDGRHLASASYDRTVRVWDHATGRELKKFEGHRDGVQGACFAPDGRFVYSAGWDKSVRKWRVPLLPAAKKVD